MSKIKSLALILGVIIMSCLIGYLVLAWTEPTAVPPGANVPTPINVSTITQTKDGRLDFTEFYDANDALRRYYVNPSGTTSAVLAGNVGIGTTGPGSKLHVSGGTGSVDVLLEADTDNVGETDQPSITLSQDGGIVTGKLGYFNSTNQLTLKNVYNDALHLGTNNTNRLTILGGGNVGIGTNPAFKLDVAGDINVPATGFLRIAGIAGTTGDVLTRTATGMTWQTGAAGGIGGGGTLNYVAKFTPDGTTIGNSIIYDDGTNVGIGTPSPGQRLDVAGNINYAEQLTKLDVADNFTATVGAADFYLGYSGRRGTPGRALVDLGSDLRFNFGPDWPEASVGSSLNVYGNLLVSDLTNCNTIDTDASGNLMCGTDETGAGAGLWTDAGTYIYPNNYTSLAITNTGNVGIGTTSPNRKLDVVGQILAKSDDALTEWIEFWPGDSAIIAKSNNPIRFGHATTPDAAGWVERMRIDTAGNVGIGDTSPDAPLEIRASGNNNPNTNALYVYNTDNAGDDDDAILSLRVGGTAAGDPFVSWDIAGEYGWSMGIDNSDANKLKIGRSWADPAYNTVLTLDTNGNVGIGTTSPDFKLDVSGDIRIESGNKLLFGGTGTADADVNLYRPAADVIRTDDAFLFSSYGRISLQAAERTLGAGAIVVETSFILPAGKTLKVWALGKGTGLSATHIDIYNNTDAVVIASVSDSTFWSEGTPTPLASVIYAADKLIYMRSRNTTSVARRNAGFAVLSIE